MNVWVSKSYEQKDTQQLLKLGLMSEKQKKKTHKGFGVCRIYLNR